MSGKTCEITFQNDMIKQLVANGWLLRKSENYHRELALYAEDVLGFVKDTQDEQWQQYCKTYPPKAENKEYPEQKFLERVASQLNKADPNAANTELRTFGTLGVLLGMATVAKYAIVQSGRLYKIMSKILHQLKVFINPVGLKNKRLVSYG